MTTSKITTVTTMMAGVVVTPSLGTLLEGCVLLVELTEAVPVGLSSVLDAEVPFSAEQKHIIWHVTRNKVTQKHSSDGNEHMVVVESKMSPTPLTTACMYNNYEH